MALKPPGTRSNLELLISSVFVLAQLALLIGGHLVWLYVLLNWLVGYGDGMAGIVAETGLPEGAVVALMAATLALDAWIVYHHQKQRKKALRRD